MGPSLAHSSILQHSHSISVLPHKMFSTPWALYAYFKSEVCLDKLCLLHYVVWTLTMPYSGYCEPLHEMFMKITWNGNKVCYSMPAESFLISPIIHVVFVGLGPGIYCNNPLVQSLLAILPSSFLFYEWKMATGEEFHCRHFYVKLTRGGCTFNKVYVKCVFHHSPAFLCWDLVQRTQCAGHQHTFLHALQISVRMDLFYGQAFSSQVKHRYSSTYICG